jgi:hypothetical protein
MDFEFSIPWNHSPDNNWSEEIQKRIAKKRIDSIANRLKVMIDDNNVDMREAANIYADLKKVSE